jgi:hypothetical protein
VQPVSTNGVAEACRLRQLLVKLHNPLSRATLVYCNNASVVYHSTNPIQHQYSKYVEIDLHFVREHVAVGGICVLHTPMTSQFADIFTKGLPSSGFRFSLQHLQWLEFRLQEREVLECFDG